MTQREQKEGNWPIRRGLRWEEDEGPAKGHGEVWDGDGGSV